MVLVTRRPRQDATLERSSRPLKNSLSPDGKCRAVTVEYCPVSAANPELRDITELIASELGTSGSRENLSCNSVRLLQEEVMSSIGNDLNTGGWDRVSQLVGT